MGMKVPPLLRRQILQQQPGEIFHGLAHEPLPVNSRIGTMQFPAGADLEKELHGYLIEQPRLGPDVDLRPACFNIAFYRYENDRIAVT